MKTLDTQERPIIVNNNYYYNSFNEKQVLNDKGDCCKEEKVDWMKISGWVFGLIGFIYIIFNIIF